MTTAPLRAVLFDWDGTLVDSAEASYRCFVRMFASFGMQFDRDTYARTYSPNWYQTFRCLELSEEHWPEADARWLDHFASESVELVAGARIALELLEHRGVTTAIVTSGSRERVTRELVAFGLDRHFTQAVFGCDVTQKKPHPEALLLCLDRLGVTPSEAAYVGDSPEDMEMARTAGVLAVAVPGAYPNRAELLAARPDLVADTIEEAVRQLVRSSNPDP